MSQSPDAPYLVTPLSLLDVLILLGYLHRKLHSGTTVITRLYDGFENSTKLKRKRHLKIVLENFIMSGEQRFKN